MLLTFGKLAGTDRIESNELDRSELLDLCCLCFALTKGITGLYDNIPCLEVGLAEALIRRDQLGFQTRCQLTPSISDLS